MVVKIIVIHACAVGVYNLHFAELQLCCLGEPDEHLERGLSYD